MAVYGHLMVMHAAQWSIHDHECGTFMFKTSAIFLFMVIDFQERISLLNLDFHHDPLLDRWPIPSPPPPSSVSDTLNPGQTKCKKRNVSAYIGLGVHRNKVLQTREPAVLLWYNPSLPQIIRTRSSRSSVKARLILDMKFNKCTPAARGSSAFNTVQQLAARPVDGFPYIHSVCVVKYMGIYSDIPLNSERDYSFFSSTFLFPSNVKREPLSSEIGNLNWNPESLEVRRASHYCVYNIFCAPSQTPVPINCTGDVKVPGFHGGNNIQDQSSNRLLSLPRTSHNTIREHLGDSCAGSEGVRDETSPTLSTKTTVYSVEIYTTYLRGPDVTENCWNCELVKV
ncbi:hypothetical protein C8R45DRAFT_1078836 [Mycena sanguinolenta]|nr:hypothetical protein C8R45DRAFT_1078836 [Mycena sanguinolenta]